MANKMNFAVVDSTKASSVRTLDGTVELTRVARLAVDEIMNKLNESFETYSQLFEESKVDHVAMETLVNELYDITSIDTGFLQDISEELIDNMIKSQQSKRSRAKSKEMTVDNYRTMMTGAVAELVLRHFANKPRSSAFGIGNGKGILEYTPEEIQALADDQEALRRAIRNVQSQKCIMKRKDGFDEASEHFQALLKVEAVLKDLRVVLPRHRADKTKDMIKQALADHDLDTLKAADSKELLKMIASMLDDEGTVEAEEVESVDTNEEVAEDAE